MSEFETVMGCLLIPLYTILIYISGKYDILGLMCKMLEEAWEKYTDSEEEE